MFVRDKMSRNVITITPDQSLHMARERMRKYGIRQLPVIEDRKLVGIVTDRDVRQAWASPATSLSTHELLYLLDRVIVAEVMTPQVFTVTPDTPLVEAARLLHDRKIGGLPVVEGKAGLSEAQSLPQPDSSLRDTGLTLSVLLQQLQARDPASLKLCVLLNKRIRRQYEITPDYIGFDVPDGFVVGYGIDYAECCRQLPDIYSLTIPAPHS